jgi:Tol biopolymer transport system component
LLSLISCTAKSNAAEAPVTLTSQPFLQITSTATLLPTLAPALGATPTTTSIPFPIPDGKIAFGDGNIQVFSTTSNDVFKVFTYEQEVQGIAVSPEYPKIAWSPDGHWIAFTGADIRADVWRYAYYDIYVAKSDGSQIKRLTYSPSSGKQSISWSPDGKYILTSMAGETGIFDLYLINSKDGEIYRRLTASTDGVYSGIWSPDGKNIAYITEKSLFVMDADGKNQRLVKDFSPEVPGDLSWSPDASTIALNVNTLKGNHPILGDIYTIKPDGTELKQITDSAHKKSSPSWSPDGKYLVFSYAPYVDGEQVTVWDMYITDLFGHERKLLSYLGTDVMASWSPVPALKIDNNYEITELSDNLNLHTSASIVSNVITKLHTGNSFTVLEGPIDADDHYWWKIKTLDGTEGWVVEMAYWYKPLNE